MVRKLSLVLELMFFVSFSAHAQGLTDKVELFGGYSYMRFNGSPSANLNGWELSGQYKVTNWLGGVADFDAHYGQGASVKTYLFGPQVSFPARVSPFAHVLIGGAHFGAGGLSNSSFSTAIGAGIDAKLAHGFAWRVIEGDFLRTHFFGSGQSNARLSTGIVFRF